MRHLRPIDNAPISTYLVALAFAVVVVGGAGATIADPAALPLVDYLALVALAGVPPALLGIGRGINEYGRQRAGADALKLAFDRGETHRPRDPEADMPPPPVEVNIGPDR